MLITHKLKCLNFKYINILFFKPMKEVKSTKLTNIKTKYDKNKSLIVFQFYLKVS